MPRRTSTGSPESGTLFENAYCSHPICCPSRANMWSGRYTHHCESWNNYKGLETGMWSLLDDLPRTHTVGTFGKLDYLSGGHTQVARLSAWLGPAGIDKPIFDEDPSQSFTVADDDRIRCHEGDWQKVDQAIEFMKAAQGRWTALFPLCQHGPGARGLSHQPVLAEPDSRGAGGHSSAGRERSSRAAVPVDGQGVALWV